MVMMNVSNSKPNQKPDKSEVDLDILSKEFDEWQEAVFGLKNQNSILEQSKVMLEKEKANLTRSLEEAHNESSKLTEIISSLQTAMAKLFDWEGECRQANQKMEIMSQSFSDAEQELKNQIEILQGRIHDLESTHNEEITILKDKCDRETAEATKKWSDIIQEGKEEITNLKQHLADYTKNKESEIVKLRLEHSAQLFKLQQSSMTSVKPLASTPSNNHDIYRKKLKHAKEDSDREILSLKRKITELQSKLDSNQPQHPSPLFNAPASRKFKNF